jgi:hypothetical protein
MDLKVLGFARPFLHAHHGLGLIDGILGHLAIGRPFAARDRQQPGIRNQDGMIAGKGRCAFGIANFH